VRQAVFVGGILKGRYCVVGVFLNRIVDAARNRRAGAVVIDAKAAADVDVFKVTAEFVQLNIELRSFFESPLPVNPSGRPST